MKKWILFILFCVQLFPGWADNRATSMTDSLLSILPTLPHDTTRLEVLQRLVLTSQGSPRLIEFARQLSAEAELQNNKHYLCNSAYFQILYYYNTDGDQDSIIKWVNFMKPIARSIEYWHVYFNSQKLLINSYIYKTQYEYAFNEASNMLEQAESVNDVDGKLAAYQCLANVYQETNRQKEEGEMLKKAYDLLPQIEHPGAKANILCQLINYNKRKKDYEHLKFYLDRTQEIIEDMIRLNPAMQKSLFDQFLFLEINYTYYYIGTDNPAAAKEHYEKCRAYITANTYHSYLLFYRNMAMEYCLYTKDYHTALAIADTTLSFVREKAFASSDYAKEIGYKADILKEMGRFTDAIPLYEKMIQIQDSVNTAVSNQQLEEIKDSYHLNQLLLNQGELKSRMQLILLILVGILLLICLHYMIRIYRIRKELRLSEQETKEATRKSEEANEVKSRFLSNMSHAIRVPLNSVVGFSQLMAADTELDDKNREEYTRIIQQNTEKLMLLVNNVLDLSRLEADMMKYQLADCDVVQLCDDAVGGARMQYPNLRIRFEHSIDQYIIHMDCNRMIQLVLSTLTGPSVPVSEEEREIHFSLGKNGETLCFRIENSPLADTLHAGQETSLRHDINRLLLKHFGGTYQAIPDAPAGPTILFTYPASKPQ